MKNVREPVTVEAIRSTHIRRSDEIRSRLEEFAAVARDGTDERFWEEMVFCFFTGGCSARMGLNSVEAVRHLIFSADRAELAAALTGVHRYPNARARYIVHTREYLSKHCQMRLRNKLQSFDCDLDRRDWLARDKEIKGLGYKEASHYLRNVGFKGYAILDKHVLNCLAELGIIEDPKPPNTRAKYLSIEDKLRAFTDSCGIDVDEMDLVLWSMKTGTILK